MTRTRVYLLRHAETADPTVFHGAESDIGLSPRGERQAAAIAAVLAAHRLAQVISSAMLRARLTAEPIARVCGIPHHVEPALHERRVAGLSLQAFDALGNVWGETVRRWAGGETGFAHPGAESFDDLQARVLPAWERLTREHAGETIAVVAHGVVCKVLLVSLLPELGVAGWPRLGPIDNVALTELVRDGGGWRAVRINETPAALRGI